MSDDLISRSVLLKIIKERVRPNKYGTSSQVLDAMGIIMHAIRTQPTAYDVDKVCMKISENKDMDNLIDADYAIKIAKSGGIE